jgi:AAHS family 4-hydroxybenzoate transporter-like MFS transporter
VLIPVIFVIPARNLSCVERATAQQQATASGVQMVTGLFAGGRLAATLALWFGVLSSMILSGFLVSFMPTILNMNGVEPGRAALGAGVLNLGAIGGALVLSATVGRRGPFVPVALSFVGGAILTVALGHIIGAGNIAFAMLFAVGAFLVGGQLTFPAIASHLFPANVRAAGIGWALAIGRLGSIIGPVVGGMLLSRHLSFDTLFMLAAILAVAAALGIALVNVLRPREENGPVTPPRSFPITGSELGEAGNGKH